MSAVYLLHLDRPISDNHTSQHYLGWASNLDGRIWHHKNGTGARFTQVAVERGIGFEVARVWEGEDRAFERKLKNQKNLAALCPHCAAERKAKKAANARALRQAKQVAAVVLALVLAYLIG
jgi:predicted GIY-YIG superfamily endonuclease